MERKRKIIYFGNHTEQALEQVGNRQIPSNGVYGFDKIAKSKDFIFEIINFKKSATNKTKYLRSLIKLFYPEQIVFSTQLLNELLLRKLFPMTQAKWLHYNLNLSYVLNKNKNNPAKKKLILKKLQCTDLIVCLTNNQKEVLMKNGVEENKLVVIPFGIDNEFYQVSRQDKGYIFSVGRDMGRDYKTLIEFARHIKEKLIVLASPRNMEDIKDIPNNVEVHYNLSYLKMRKFYENAKIIIIPSKHENYTSDEPISDCSGQTVILESMACGKPVITSERSWIYDYGLKNSLLLYKAEYANDLLIKYSSLINNQNRQKELGLAARKMIDEKYNVNNMTEGFTQIFNTL